MDERHAARGDADQGERGRVPSEADPDPTPERDLPEPLDEDGPDGVDRGGGGEPVGNDNIRTGRVRGVLGTPHGQHGQGQGG